LICGRTVIVSCWEWLIIHPHRARRFAHCSSIDEPAPGPCNHDNIRRRAALMAALAESDVCSTLLRHRQSRIVGAARPCFMPPPPRDCTRGGQLALARSAQNPAAAPTWRKWWRNSRPTCARTPNDRAGWIMLGRSSRALERLDDASWLRPRARLDAGNAEDALGIGEAMSLRRRGEAANHAGSAEAVPSKVGD